MGAPTTKTARCCFFVPQVSKLLCSRRGIEKRSYVFVATKTSELRTRPEFATANSELRKIPRGGTNNKNRRLSGFLMIKIQKIQSDTIPQATSYLIKRNCGRVGHQDTDAKRKDQGRRHRAGHQRGPSRQRRAERPTWWPAKSNR